MSIQELITYIQVMKRRWKPIVGLFLGTMVTLFILSTLAPQVYLATAQLQVIAPPPGAVTLYGGFRTSGFRDEVAYTQNTFIQIVQGWVVARRTIETIDTQLGTKELRERTEVTVESDFIKLTVAGDEANEAVQLANGLSTEALTYYGELLARSSSVSREFISTQLELARQELDYAQTDLMQFKIENKIGSLDGDIGQQTNLIRALRLSRDDAMANSDITKANAYDALIIQREKELQDLLNLSAQYQSLQSAVNQASNTYNFLLGKETDAKLAENQTSNVNFILVVEPASPPEQSTSTFKTSLLALGGVLSLILGLTIAFAWEYVETSNAQQEEDHDDSSHQQTVHVN